VVLTLTTRQQRLFLSVIIRVLVGCRRPSDLAQPRRSGQRPPHLTPVPPPSSPRPTPAPRPSP